MTGAEQPAAPTASVCFTRCWMCMFDAHYDPPLWHSWAGDEDVAHAERTGQPDPRETACGCWCARGGTP